MAHITMCYECYTPDDMEAGEPSERGVYDVIECADVDDAVERLRREVTDLSASFYHPGVWYCHCEDNFRTGMHTCYSYHLKGFSLENEQAIYEQIRGLLTY